MGITEVVTAPRSPWQNPYAEGLIGSIRRQCVDHLVVLGEAHLCRMLSRYGDYYNEVRTHLSLSKNAPVYRIVQRIGQITEVPLLGGLHHRYVRT